MTLEPVIPEHLTQERTQPSNLPANYVPPFPAYVARFPTDVKDIVMVVIGAQYENGSRPSADSHALTKLIDFLKIEPEKYNPRYWEPASVTDNSGALNEVVIAYWNSQPQYEAWSENSGFGKWWESLDAEVEEHGWFLEIFLPTVERFETLFSDNKATEGSAYMKSGISGEISEHVYWGSMRDRIPLSQTDAMEGTKGGVSGNHGAGSAAPVKKRISVQGKKNLAVIRSGQDWSNTKPEERKLYVETMQPVLVKGMEFLRDDGNEVGCFSCRYMDVLDHDTLKAGIEKTFGFAYFDDLASLEGWAKQHKTHLDIFGGFLRYAQKLDNDVSLRLFHEVLVLEPKQQLFEYVGCHAKTGMLAAPS